MLSLMLPETLGHNLPETLEDGEKLGLVLPRCLSNKDSSRDVKALEEEDETFSRI